MPTSERKSKCVNIKKVATTPKEEGQNWLFELIRADGTGFIIEDNLSKQSAMRCAKEFGAFAGIPVTLLGKPLTGVPDDDTDD